MENSLNEEEDSVTATNEPYESVEFINQQVLSPEVKPIEGTSKVMVDQAAAMMVQDMETFVQGTEQVMMLAIAKASEMVASEDPIKQAAGIAALTEFQNFLLTLPVYATAIGTSASSIVSGFPGLGEGEGGEGETEIKENTSSPSKVKSGKLKSFFGF